MNNRTLLVVAAIAGVIVGWLVFSARQPQSYVDAETKATPLEQMSEFSTISADREVVVHCGNSMRLVMEHIAAEFQRRYEIAVVFNYGGSSELLPLIEFGGRGDLFICHDPYAEILAEKNLLVDYVVVGELKPIILVERGNPRNINNLADLGRDGLRFATVDSRYATAGKMVHEVLDREPWGDKVRGNLVIESRSHSDAVVSLLTGHTHAAVVWSFLAPLYANRLDKIDSGVEFGERIRVTICRLTTSENPEETEKFKQFVESDYAAKAFEYYGYLVSDTE